MEPQLELLDSRHELSPEQLSEFVSTNFGGNLLTLRQLEPYIVEIRRRFRRLPRKMQVNGTYKTIAGHRNFKSWCSGILKRTDRCVRYMLAKSKNEKPRAEKAETIYAPLNRCIAYIKQQHLDKQTETKILDVVMDRIKEVENGNLDQI